MHMHQQNHWNRVLFYWYQSYHWHQWTISLTNRIRLCLLDMCAAEKKAKQLEMEEERRTKEFAKQLEIKHKIEQAGNVAQRIELEAKERRKTQEAKDEAARLASE